MNTKNNQTPFDNKNKTNLPCSMDHQVFTIKTVVPRRDLLHP